MAQHQPNQNILYWLIFYAHVRLTISLSVAIIIFGFHIFRRQSENFTRLIGFAVSIHIARAETLERRCFS